ncbi:MAG TPA: ankyrin repeat domain-containing protein [Brumimicrobium sp.]|nr:ankyrin repeat domain-containing protein [Brumimicrobium sp.]
MISKLFKTFNKKKKILALPEAEQLRLRELIMRCDLDLITNEFTTDNVDILLEELTPFQWAIYENCEVLINHFIKLGADINRPYLDGNSALIIVCGQGSVELAEILLKNQASLSYINENKTSAIWYATTDVNPKLVRLLLEYGADPFTDTGNGKSSYEIAKIMHLEEIVAIMEEFRK